MESAQYVLFCLMQRTSRHSTTIRVSALLVALLVFGLRIVSPALHHHGLAGDSAQHLQQDGCPSCDYESTSALGADETPILPESALIGSLLPNEPTISLTSASPYSRLRGRAPPSSL